MPRWFLGVVSDSDANSRSRSRSLRESFSGTATCRLTSDGMNLEGVRQVIALTQEIERLQAAVAALEAELRAQAHRHRHELEAVRRSARRDLVPYSSAIVRYEHPSRYSEA